MRLKGTWSANMVDASGFSYNCGYCGSKVGPSKKFYCLYLDGPTSRVSGNVLICPSCNKPSFVNEIDVEQVPGETVGETIEHLPGEIENLYNEARNCLSVNAFTSSVLSCRKLLMNVSVSKGAEPGESFASYVTFLEQNHFIPPDSRSWVDHIRKKGNEATHEIPSISKDDAVELFEFTEMLLRFVYELPGKMTRHRS